MRNNDLSVWHIVDLSISFLVLLTFARSLAAFLAMLADEFPFPISHCLHISHRGLLLLDLQANSVTELWRYLTSL